MSPRQRKFIEGDPLPPLEVIKRIMAREYVIESGRRMHPGFMCGRQLNDIWQSAAAGRIREALPNPDHPDNQQP